jgi:hypothetical protein
VFVISGGGGVGLVGCSVGVADDSLLVDLVGVGVAPWGRLSLGCSVTVDCTSNNTVEVNVAVNVAVKVAVGVKPGVLVLVGVVVAKTSKASKGDRTNTSAVRVLIESINSTDVNSVVVSRILTRFFTGTVKVASKSEDSSAALLASDFATVNIPAAASAI